MNQKQTESVKWHSLHIIALLLATLFGGSIAIGLLVQRNPFIKGLDSFFYHLINVQMPHPAWFDVIMKPFNYNFLPGLVPSYFYFMFAGFLLYMFIYKRSLFLWSIFCLVAGTFLAAAVTAFDWHFVFRERPFTQLPSTVDDIGRQAWTSWSSFPSGHTRETALYVTIMASFEKKLIIPAILFVIFIAFTRVYVGAHYPTDVIAGGLIGYLTAKVILIVARELQIIFAPLQHKFIKGGNHAGSPTPSKSDINQD